MNLTCAIILAASWVSLLLCGCESVGYYRQAIRGQYQILASRQSIDLLLAKPETPVMLREKFHAVLEIRQFAEHGLKLPANGHYLRYADLHRRYVVWNVHAAPEFSLLPRTWWYPVVGRLDYSGYFSEAAARRYAAKMERKGLDAFVEGVEAYSTLGWFRDPVLNTFIEHPPPELAEILLHELAHQRVFAPGDTDFNEAFATAVAEEGVGRWLRAAGDAAASGNYQTSLQRNAQFVQLIMATRSALEALYATDPSRGRSSPKNLTDQERSLKRKQKSEAIERLRQNYEQLKAQWGGYAGYDHWFAQSLNNAQLNTVAIYYQWVPAFHRILEQSGGNLEKFYQEVKGLTKLAKEERHRRLNRLLESSGDRYFTSPSAMTSSPSPWGEGSGCGRLLRSAQPSNRFWLEGFKGSLAGNGGSADLRADPIPWHWLACDRCALRCALAGLRGLLRYGYIDKLFTMSNLSTFNPLLTAPIL